MSNSYQIAPHRLKVVPALPAITIPARLRTLNPVKAKLPTPIICVSRLTKNAVRLDVEFPDYDPEYHDAIALVEVWSIQVKSLDPTDNTGAWKQVGAMDTTEPNSSFKLNNHSTRGYFLFAVIGFDIHERPTHFSPIQPQNGKGLYVGVVTNRMNRTLRRRYRIRV